MLLRIAARRPARGDDLEREVQNAKDSLGAPDGRYAEILPGGQLVVLMENKPYPFPIIGGISEFGGGPPDSGSVVGKGGADISLEGWFPMQDTQGKQHYDWIPVGLSATGFCIFPPPLPNYSFEGSAGVDMIRITNPGTRSLFVDAVIGCQVELNIAEAGHHGRRQTQERRESQGPLVKLDKSDISGVSALISTMQWFCCRGPNGVQRLP